MKIGVVADGDSEVAALPKLYDSISAASGNSLAHPIKAEVHPEGKIGTIVKNYADVLQTLTGKEFDKVVVLIDRERRDECCGTIAAEIVEALKKREEWQFELAVVVKDRTFEHWLIADIRALKAQQARFRLNETAATMVSQRGADALDADALLKRWAIKPHSYQKIKDSVRILEQADPLRMAMTSRSFRRFLHCLGHPAYSAQSRKAAKWSGGDVR